MKQELYDRIEALKAELCAISDDIYDHPEIGLTEKHASKLLEFEYAAVLRDRIIKLRGEK